MTTTHTIQQVRGKVSNDKLSSDVLVDLQLDDKEEIVSLELTFGIKVPADGAYRLRYDFNGRSHEQEGTIGRSRVERQSSALRARVVTSSRSTVPGVSFRS
jgi:hypothetical protein